MRGLTLADTAFLGAASGFSPLSLSPAFWFDAADTSTIVSSGSPAKVSQWSDRSGNGRHAPQAVALYQPTTGATTRNGRNVIDFDGNARFLGPTVTGFDPAANGVSIFVAAQTISKPSGNGATQVLSQQDVAGLGRALLGKGDGSLPHQTFLGGAQTTVGAGTDGWFRHRITCAAGANQTLSLVQNGTTTTTATRTIETTVGGLCLGIGKTTIANTLSSWWGAIGEIIVYGQVLSAANIALVETYLADKWAIP